MIRDERQAALDEVIVALQNEADHARDAADRLADDDQLAELLRSNASRYDAFAERLKLDMQSLDDLPSEPDQEAEILEGLFSRIHAALSGDARAAVVQERIDRLAQLLESLQAALRSDPPQAIAEHLQAAARYVQTANDRLRALAPPT